LLDLSGNGFNATLTNMDDSDWVSSTAPLKNAYVTQSISNRARDYAGNHHAILYNMDTFHCFKPSHVWDTYNQSAQNELIIYAGYDTDMDDTVTIHMISQPEHGGLEIHPFDQQMIYLPSENYVGDDAFTFQLSDGRKNHRLHHSDSYESLA
jgi:hypothetical protein